jgi:hypothetical protein
VLHPPVTNECDSPAAESDWHRGGLEWFLCQSIDCAAHSKDVRPRCVSLCQAGDECESFLTSVEVRSRRGRTLEMCFSTRIALRSGQRYDSHDLLCHLARSWHGGSIPMGRSGSSSVRKGWEHDRLRPVNSGGACIHETGICDEMPRSSASRLLVQCFMNASVSRSSSRYHSHLAGPA